MESLTMVAKQTTRRPFLSQMMKRARVVNKDKPLPPPQDMKMRLAKGQTVRLSFTRFPLDLVRGRDFPNLEEKPVFSGGYRHYVDPQYDDTDDGIGGYVLCKGRGNCRWCSHKDENTSYARLAIATTVVVWPCDRNGVVDYNALYKGMFDVMPWVFGKKIYKELSVIQNEFPLGEFDLLVTCDREQYQRITIRPTKGNMYKKILSVSENEQYWLNKGLSKAQAKERMSYYSGICSAILQDTKGFTKLLPMVLGKEQL